MNLQYISPNNLKYTNNRLISLTGTHHSDSKLSIKIFFFEKDIRSVFFQISKNLWENQSPEVLFWKGCAFPLTEKKNI